MKVKTAMVMSELSSVAAFPCCLRMIYSLHLIHIVHLYLHIGKHIYVYIYIYLYTLKTYFVTWVNWQPKNKINIYHLRLSHCTCYTRTLSHENTAWSKRYGMPKRTQAKGDVLSDTVPGSVVKRLVLADNIAPCSITDGLVTLVKQAALLAEVSKIGGKTLLLS